MWGTIKSIHGSLDDDSFKLETIEMFTNSRYGSIKTIVEWNNTQQWKRTHLAACNKMVESYMSKWKKKSLKNPKFFSVKQAKLNTLSGLEYRYEICAKKPESMATSGVSEAGTSFRIVNRKVPQGRLYPTQWGEGPFLWRRQRLLINLLGGIHGYVLRNLLSKCTCVFYIILYM